MSPLGEREFDKSILSSKSPCLKNDRRDFPGGPVAKNESSQCRGLGLIPGQVTRSHMPQLCCN